MNVWMVVTWFDWQEENWGEVEAIFDSPVKAGEMVHAIVSEGGCKKARVVKKEVR